MNILYLENPKMKQHSAGKWDYQVRRALNILLGKSKEQVHIEMLLTALPKGHLVDDRNGQEKP